MGKIDIGLYDLTSLAGFPSLCSIIISAIFQQLGICCNLITALNRYVNITIAFLGRFLSSSPGLSLD
jgi:hypothetical protein